MSTRKIVPRIDGEGGIGTDAKAWGDGIFKDRLKLAGKPVLVLDVATKTIESPETMDVLSLLDYLGDWNADTNSPTITTGTASANKRVIYRVSVAGSTTVDGISTWFVGDWIYSDGVAWRNLNSAIRDYADSLVLGLFDDRGNYDASSNLFPSSGGSGTAGAVKKGDIWTIEAGGGGVLGGETVEPGDLVRALVDAPGQTASNWATTENNLGYAPLNPANNLSELDDASTARSNLELGVLSTLTPGTGVEAALEANVNGMGGIVLFSGVAGALTVTTLNGNTITGSGTLALSTFTLTVAGTASISGTHTGTSSNSNTGDQTSIVGITGDITAFNNALTGADFATLAGTEALTNKTINGNTITAGAGTLNLGGNTLALPSGNVTIQGGVSGGTINLGSGTLNITAGDTVSIGGGVISLTGISVTLPASGTLLSTTDIGVSVQAYDADLTTWAGITPGANVGTFLATPSGANLASALTSALPVTKGGTALDTSASTGIPVVAAGTWSIETPTGTGAPVRGTSPEFTTSITTGDTTFSLLNTTATTVNAFGAATAINIGTTNTTGTVTIGNASNSTGSLIVLNTLDATSVTGAIRTSGGISAAKALNIGTDATIGGAAQVAGKLTANGGRRSAYLAKTALYTIVSATDYCINCTANSFTVTFPTAVSIAGQEFIVKNSGTGVITIATTSGQTIDGWASGSITLSPGDSLSVMSDGANLIIT